MSTTRRRILLGTAVGLGVLLLGGAALTAALVLRFDAGVDRRTVDITPNEDEDDDANEPSSRESERDPRQSTDREPQHQEPELPDPVDEVVTFLVAGSDDRSVLSDEERAELSTGDAEGERTETNMLVRLDPDGPRADVLSLPRDALVERCDGSRGRLNAAYSIGERGALGGPSCLMQTVANWTGVAPDHFVKVDFRGFVDLVDGLDGLQMWLANPIRDPNANLDLEAGCQELDGGDALAFARARYVDNDFGRMARQQRLLVELRDEVVSGQTVTSPTRLLGLTDTAASSLEVDDALTLDRMRQLAVTGREVPSEAITTATVPGEHAEGDTSFLRVDDAELAQLVDAFEAGTLNAVTEPEIAEETDDTSGPQDEGEGEGERDDESADEREDRDTADEGDGASGDTAAAGSEDAVDDSGGGDDPDEADGPDADFAGTDRGPGC